MNLTVLDAKIRKLQKLRELLANDGIRELIADPEVMTMLREAVATNGNGVTRQSVPPQEEEDNLPADGSLKRAVLETARACAAKFDTRLIVETMRKDGFHFEAKKPGISVNQALNSLANNGLIRRVRSGSGRQPNIYEAVRKEATQ